MWSDTEEEASPPARTEPRSRRCSSDELGYSIAYPADWHQAHCAFFDPEPFEVPENSDFYGAALEVLVAQDSFDNLVRGLTDPRFSRVISHEDVTINGLRGARVEVEATGKGLFERGYGIYAYVLDVPGRPPVIVQATRPPRAGWGDRKTVADRAVRSLELAPLLAEEDRPPPVAEKRAAIRDAPLAHDYDALARLADPEQFTYTFGAPHPDGPAGYWREAVARGDREPVEILAALLQLPHTRAEQVYVWPFAYNRAPAGLTEQERRRLLTVATREELESWGQAGSYLGWRTGITSDGRWTYFVAGD